MQVPSYKSEIQRAVKSGSGRLSVQANPGQFAQTGQALSRFGQVAQSASLNALSLAEKTKTSELDNAEKVKLQFLEQEKKNIFEAEKEKATLNFNEGLIGFQLKAKKMDPNKSDKFFQDKSDALRKTLAKNFTSENAKKDFISKSNFDYLNKSVSVRANSSSRRIDEQASVYIARVEQLENQIVVGNKGEKGAATFQLFGQGGVYDKLVSLGYWTKSEGVIKSQKSKENILKNTIVYDFQNKGTLEDKKAYIDALIENPPKSLDVLGTRVIATKLRADVTRQENIIKRQALDLKATVKELKTILVTGNVSQETIDAANAKAKTLGNLGVEVRKEINELIIKKEIFDELKKGSPTNIAGLLNQYSNGISNVGGPGIDTTIEAQVFKEGKALERNMLQKLKTDPLTFATRNGNFDIKSINFGSENSQQLIGERINKSFAVSANYESELKFLTSAEVSGMKNYYENTNVSTDLKLAMVARIVSGFGSMYAQNVLEELSIGSANDLAHIGGLVNQGNIPAATHAMKGQELIANGAKPLNYKTTNTSSYSTIVSSALAELDPSVQGSTLKIVKDIYTDRAKGLDDFDIPLFEDSIQLALGKNGQNGGIQEVNGTPTLLPPNLNSSDLTTMLKNISAKELFELNGITVDKKLMENINGSNFFSLDNSAGEYSLYAVGEGVYKLGRGTYGDSSFVWAADTDGAEIEIDAIKWKNTYGVSE